MNRLFATVCGGLLIMGLTTGCGTARAPSAARPATASASALQSPPRATVTAVPAGTPQPAGGPVPAGFRAASVTFVSTLEAFVLGTAPCKHAPCTSIVRSRDRGVSWRGLPAPVVPLVANMEAKALMEPTAIRDSLVASLSREAFDELTTRFPRIVHFHSQLRRSQLECRHALVEQIKQNPFAALDLRASELRA